eukprot:scaffold88687_cov72-Phaeocystis_antarctica.AAC.2
MLPDMPFSTHACGVINGFCSPAKSVPFPHDCLRSISSCCLEASYMWCISLLLRRPTRPPPPLPIDCLFVFERSSSSSMRPSWLLACTSWAPANHSCTFVALIRDPSASRSVLLMRAT